MCACWQEGSRHSRLTQPRADWGFALSQDSTHMNLTSDPAVLQIVQPSNRIRWVRIIATLGV